MSWSILFIYCFSYIPWFSLSVFFISSFDLSVLVCLLRVIIGVNVLVQMFSLFISLQSARVQAGSVGKECVESCIYIYLYYVFCNT